MDRIFKMKFNSVYDALVNKALRKNRTLEEVIELTVWFTGYTKNEIEEFREDDNLSYVDFFRNAPELYPNRDNIIGKICGVQIENIEDPDMKIIRQFDKIVDELARGKDINKIKDR